MGIHLEVGPTILELAQFETTSRVIAALLNERLVDAFEGKCSSTSDSANGIFLGRPGSEGRELPIWIGTSDRFLHSTPKCSRVYHPADFRLPVMVRSMSSSQSGFAPETHPAKVLTAARPLFDIDEKLFDEAAWAQILTQVENSSRNQVAWIAWAMKQPRAVITSSALDWEQH